MVDIKRNKAFCILPWIHTYFYPDGKVALCCISPSLLRDDRSNSDLNIQTHSLGEIFNSTAYESVRKAMLDGTRVANCSACYHEETYSQNSHRIFYNNLWLKGRYSVLNLLEKIEACGEKNIVSSPLSVDYRLGNLCNLKCQICNPQNSSQIEKDPEFSAWNPCQYLRLPHRFKDAAEWYESEELKNEIIRSGDEIRYIKLAGGEPTINRTLISWLEHLVSSGKAGGVELSISTNFTNTNRAFYELLEAFGTVNLHLSIDGYGELNDYLRYPSNWSAIRRNIEYVCKRRDEGAPFVIDITPVISVYNALQIVELFDWAEEMGIGIIANEVRGVPQIDCGLIPPKARRLACERIGDFLHRSRSNATNPTIISLLHKLEEPFDENMAYRNIQNFFKFTSFVDSSRKLVFSEVCVEASEMLQEYYGQTRGTGAMDIDEATRLFRQGRQHEAIAACQKVLQVDPENFDAVQLIGKAAKQLGQLAHAENFFRAALAMRPDSIDALNELGAVLILLGRLEQALEYFRRTLELHPDSHQANFNISTVLFAMDRIPEALQYCQASIALKRDFAEAHVRLGMIHYRLEDLHRSLRSSSEAFLLAPDDINVLNLLALNKIALGVPDEAIPYLEKVLARFPGDEFANARMREALCYMQDLSSAKEALYNSGLVDLAEKMARDDLSRSDSVENHNFLLKCYLVSNKHSASDYFRESREWARAHEHEDALPSPGEFRNDRDPDRRLRVGIVGDYFISVIGMFTLYPIFKQYDRDKIELYCYNFGPGAEELRPVVDCYRDIAQMSGQDFFKLVRDDAIDIMLDINGRIRTPNYFETLLRQPAPIQVNWYNLPCTVGVKAFNYVISDKYCIREGEENVYVEKVFRMPTGTICAWDMGGMPVVLRPPSEQNGFITFGCFGDFFKVREDVLEVWTKLLKLVPDSRLYLKSNNLRLLSERKRVSDFFSARGIAPERLILEGLSLFNAMKKCYEWVDIALDTFPYSSGSTTINALWQGIPVVAIEGEDWRGRSTAAVLVGCRLDDLIAKDVDGYIRLACALAADPARLADLRTNLGKRVAASPQWNVEAFTRNFEARLRMIWHDWLKSQ